MWRIMKSKSWRRGDSNFILQSYCAFFFHFSLSFCWVFLAYSDLHHPALKKLPKLPHTHTHTISCFSRYPFIDQNSRISLVWPVFFPVWNKGVFVPVYWSVRYIPAVPTGTVWNWLPWIKIQIICLESLKKVKDLDFKIHNS